MSPDLAGSPLMAGTRRKRIRPSVGAELFSDGTRTAQTVLGLIWLLDGGLQYQHFMYTHGFIDMLTSMSSGQPHWLGASINWGANIAAGNLTVWNSIFATVQVLIGLGLLYRPTVRAALLASFAWAAIVWWFGEGFGMLFMNMAQPLTGAPGAVMYVLVGLVIWPTDYPGGLLGIRGTRIMWALVWCGCAYLWLLQASAATNAIHDTINAAPSGMAWLSSMQDGFASITHNAGLVYALALALLSAAIGLGVGFSVAVRPLIAIAVILQILYWLVGQGFGGIFQGGATDPNSAPLFILLAYVVAQIAPYRLRTTLASEHGFL